MVWRSNNIFSFVAIIIEVTEYIRRMLYMLYCYVFYYYIVALILDEFNSELLLLIYTSKI